MNTSSKERLECIRLLLENGASVNHQDYQGCTPLHKATVSDCAESIVALLGHGACPKVQDNLGNTPLHEATKLSHTNVIKTLIEAKEEYNEHRICSIPHNRPQYHIEESTQDQNKEEDREYVNEEYSAPSSRSMEVFLQLS